MKKLWLHLLLIAGLGTGARSQEIAFNTGSWNEIMQQAHEQHKPVFVDLYFEGCMPCRQMDLHSFNDKELGAYMNGNFISYKTDVLNEEDGILLAMRYAVTGFPTFLFISEEGKIIDISSGYTDPDAFLAMAMQVKKADENKQFKNYAAGMHPDLPSFYKDRYLHRDKKTEQQTVISFLKEQSSPDGEIPFLVMTAFSLDETFNNYYFDHAAALSEKYGRMVVRNKMINIIKLKTKKLAGQKSKAAMLAMLKQAQPIFSAEEWDRFAPLFMEDYEKMAGN